MAFQKGTRLGPYEIQDLLGRGGMGEVYRARDTRIGREVAIKVIGDSFVSDKDHTARFAREARVLATINDPNIAALYEFESNGQQDYVVMELVEGETLAQRLTHGPLPLTEALPLLLQVAKGLEAAHRRGIVHRDLKPANIKITPDETAKILDFGLSKIVDESGQSRFATTPPPTLDNGTTQDGQVLGTPPYMSPEQVKGSDVDKRTDVWSFGCVLYEVLSGRRAFGGDSPSEIMTSVLTREPDWQVLSNQTPENVSRLLRRCLCKDPRERLQDIGDARIELADAVTHARADGEVRSLVKSPWRRTRRLTWMTLLAIVSAVVLSSLVFLFRPARAPQPAPLPVVLLMDSVLSGNVYDEETRRSGLTNAHDLTAVLRDLPVTSRMELISPAWEREREVIEEHPALILIHRSGFVEQEEVIDWSSIEKELAQKIFREVYQPGWEKLLVFLGTVAASTQETKFLVYSRGWNTAKKDEWSSEAIKRFPALSGKLNTFSVPTVDGKGSFREAETATLVKQKVAFVLGLARDSASAPE